MRSWKKWTAVAAVAMTASSATPAAAQVGDAVRGAGRAAGGAVRGAANAVGNTADNAGNRAANAANRTRLRGNVVRVEGNNQFLVRTPEGRQVTVYSTPETRYRFDNRDAQFTDVRQGAEVDLGYTLREDKYYAVDVTNPAADSDPASPEPGAASRLRGVIRQPQQLSVRTSDGKDVTVWVEGDQEFNLVVHKVGDRWVLASATSANNAAGADARETNVRETDSRTTDDVRRDNAEPVRDGARRQPGDATPSSGPRRDPVSTTPREAVREGRDAVREGREAVREGREAARETRDEVRDAVRENSPKND